MEALPFIKALLSPRAKDAWNTTTDTRPSYVDIGELVRVLFERADGQLEREYCEEHPDLSHQATQRVINDLGIVPPVEPTRESPATDASPTMPAPSNAVASPEAP